MAYDAACISAESAALGPAFGRVIGDALNHEQRAHVGVAQPQGAIVIRLLSHDFAGKLSHVNGDFEDERPQARCVPEGVDIKVVLAEDRKT